MERRHFMKLAFGFAAGAAALAASARAAPLMPHPLAEDGPLSPSNEDARPAVTTGDEVEHLKPRRGALAPSLGLASSLLAPPLLAPPLLLIR